MILHRHIQMGGLGLHHVKMKALALLIKTFMKTAAHPAFTHNLLHSTLYRVHVLGDDSITSPHAIKKALFAKKSASLLMMQEKSSNDHDENKENLMKDLETTVEIKEKVITYIHIYFFLILRR